MQTIYLDISGDVEFRDPNQHLCVLGMVSCANSRIPQILLKTPLEKNKQITDFFRQHGEFKFSAMRNAKPRVQELLEETLCAIAKEPSLTLYATTMRGKKHEISAYVYTFYSSVEQYGDVSVIADNGSLDEYTHFFRVFDASKDEKRRTVMIGLGDKIVTNTDELTLQFGLKKPEWQIVPIKHERSHDYKGIQIADLIAGAVRRNEELNDSKWFDMISHRVKMLDRDKKLRHP